MYGSFIYYNKYMNLLQNYNKYIALLYKRPIYGNSTSGPEYNGDDVVIRSVDGYFIQLASHPVSPVMDTANRFWQAFYSPKMIAKMTNSSYQSKQQSMSDISSLLTF